MPVVIGSRRGSKYKQGAGPLGRVGGGAYCEREEVAESPRKEKKLNV